MLLNYSNLERSVIKRKLESLNQIIKFGSINNKNKIFMKLYDPPPLLDSNNYI